MRMQWFLTWIASFLLAAACGGSQPSEKQPPQTVVEPQTSPQTGLGFEELRFYEGDTHMLTLRKDGVLINVPQNQHTATLKPDMTLEATNGKHGSLAADGTITFDGATLDRKVGDDGTLSLGDSKVKLEDDGMLSGQGPGGKTLRVEGATTPQSKRIALYLLALLTAPVKKTPPPPPKEEPKCTDGSGLTCDAQPEPCEEGLVRSVIAGCWAACVDAETCKPPEKAEPEPKTVKKKKKRRR